MILIWGQRRSERKMGYVAEFCPACRDIAPFRIDRIGVTGHLWYVSFFKGKLMGHEATCQNCGTTMEVDATLYESFSRSGKKPLPELVQQTFPTIRTLRGEQLELEQRIRAGTLKPQEREQPMMAALHVFTPRVEEALSGGLKFNRPASLCMGLTFALLVLLVGMSVFSQALASVPKDTLISLGMGIFAFGFATALGLMFFNRKRRLKKEIIPLMARCLRPLRPSRPELEYCLNRFKKAEMAVGQHVPLDLLWAELEKPAFGPAATKSTQPNPGASAANATPAREG